MIIPIIIHVNESGDSYGVTVPGLHGCYSAGNSLEEATVNVTEALDLHIEHCHEEGIGVDGNGKVKINTNIENAFDEADGGIIVCIMYENDNAVSVDIT
jgi:predicted RNase H-like HicB family nuclease